MFILKQLLSAFRFSFLLLFIDISMTAFAQKKTSPAKNEYLKLEWRPKQNNYQGKEQYLSELIITNVSGKPLPAKGWTIYFNFGGGFVQPVNNGLTASFLNGDLYQLKPNVEFTGLHAGKSLVYPFIIEGRLTNFTEGPRGFYLVSDNDPMHAFSLNNLKINPDREFLKSGAADHPANDWNNPSNIFTRNRNITDMTEDQIPKIFPTPIEYQNLPGEFNLTAETLIHSDILFTKEASYLASELGNVLKNTPRIVSPSTNTEGVLLQKGNSVPGGYSLSVSPTQIIITASTGEGIFYGIQSLKTLLPPLSWKSKQQVIKVSCLEVKDAPLFDYRSFMLDVARNFQPKEEILRILDLMSLYKLNVFHFHLTEDEGWRLEIPSLPELTQVGSKRGYPTDNKDHLQPSFGSGPDTTSLPGSGYYSRKDFIDILKYAAERYIQVVPEIESPGHARAAIKSMETRYKKLMSQGKEEEARQYLLSESTDSSSYRSVQGWNDNVINVALPSVYHFMEKVIDDLIGMYKEAGSSLKTIHFGGDEVPNGVWARSPAFQQLKKTDSTVKSTNDLWYYYYGKLNELLKKRGLFISGWEEMGMRKTSLDGHGFYLPNPDFINEHFQLDVWNNVIGSGSEDLAYRLANAGDKVILSCVTNLYFDLACNSSFNEPGQHWGGYVDVDKPFYFIPFDYLKNVKEDADGIPVANFNQVGKNRLTDYGKSNIAGIQGLLWSENNINTDRLEYMLLPKILGFAERAWAKNPEWATEKDSSAATRLYNQAWSLFVNTLGKRELPRISYYHGGFNFRIPMPGLQIDNGNISANIQFPGLPIRYTLDGSDPVATSQLYSQPINSKGIIRAAAFNDRSRRGIIAEIETR